MFCNYSDTYLNSTDMINYILKFENKNMKKQNIEWNKERNHMLDSHTYFNMKK